MILETVESEGLAHFSYVLGDHGAGVCAVIDPRRDVGIYLDIARRHDARITCILETHIHADFVSGSRELAARTGAPICAAPSPARRFEHRTLEDGATLELGPLTVRTLHTPGHSPEHACFLAVDESADGAAWGLFTGDTLFAGSVGRPDLAVDMPSEEMARQLYRSITERILPLGDHVLVYPGHGAGSPCGGSIADRHVTTIGYERRHSPKLQAADEEGFVRSVLADLPHEPAYYKRMKRLNARGPEVVGDPPHLSPLDAHEFRAGVERDGGVVLDTREIEAFGGAHVPGSVNIALRTSFPVWAGRILDPDQPVYLVVTEGRDAGIAQRHLFRIGIDRVAGYLRQGMRSWLEAGFRYDDRRTLSVHELRDRILEGLGELQLLDVRSDAEWAEGRIAGARHIYVPELEARLDELDRSRPVAVYCGTGYRSSLAASLLARNGFPEVRNVPGSVTAWLAEGYPLEHDDEPAADRLS